MRRVGLGLKCLALAMVAMAMAESEPNAFAPVLDMKDVDGKPVDVYKGFIVSDEDTVSLVPELKASDDDKIGGARFICGYRIYSDDEDIPFEAVMSSHSDGRAKLKVKPGVQIAELRRQKYKFDIAAYDCGSPTLHSKMGHVVVKVLPAPQIKTPPLPADIKKLIDQQIDVVESNSGKKELLESPPVPDVEATTVGEYPKLPLPDQGGEAFFERPSYIVAMRESTLYDSILRLRAAEGHSTANICGYEIITPSVPFTVDEAGNIRNTKALDYETQKSYIISVVAKHCDGLVSKPTVINVQVSQICSNGWKDLPTDMEYRAGTRAIKPLEKTWFDTCSVDCQYNQTMSVTVSLESKGELKTCKHDTFSIQSQRESCGASSNTVDLLPQGEPWTKELTPIEGHEAAYKFDGKTAVKVPSTRSNHTLDKFFTISFWMEHGEEKKDGHKEHVLCNADGDGMNRHHYSLFVHNCRLVFLLRKEADQVESLDKFMPAEWRWTIPHVCDSNWHHYAISVDYPEIKLYIDGQRIQDDKDTVEVVDDWALHRSKKVHYQQLTVGACWQGETSDFGQYFDGSLADISIVTGSSETDRVIKCMNDCGQKLQFQAMDKLQVGMSVSFNTELSEITIAGNDFNEVKKLIREIGYTNTDGEPKTGYRTLRVKTTAECDNQQIPVKEQTIPIMIAAETDPEITIFGVAKKMRSPAEFAEGVDVFTEVTLVSAPDKQTEGQENRINKLSFEDISMLQKDLKEKLLLDRCEVRVDAKMDPKVEKLRLPSSLLVKYLMDTKEFDQGFDITGSESFTHYEEVIRETFYHNTDVKPDFAGRKFTVTCSSKNRKYMSNTFTTELNVETLVGQSKLLYSDPEPEYAHIAASETSLSARQNNKVVANNNKVKANMNATVVTVVVVCVVLLVIVIVVAVMRIRTVQRRGSKRTNVAIEDGPEMEWDNSTLNITVNPLESDGLMGQTRDATAESEAESEDEMMSSDDEDPLNKDGLEWDNSLTY